MPGHQHSDKTNHSKIHQPTPQESSTQDVDTGDIQQSEIDSGLIDPAQLLYLQRTIGNAAVQRYLADAKSQGESSQNAMQDSSLQPSDASITSSEQLSRQPDDAADTVQRQFAPVTTTNNAHLRNDGQWSAYVGDRIDSGSEIVVDKAQQKTEKRKWRSDATWTKAVNVSGQAWVTGDSAKTTYVRDSSIGAAKQYPLKTDNSKKPPNREVIETPQINWHHLTGEFIEIEDSVSTPGAKIAWHKGGYKRINPATGQIDVLDADEGRQVDSTVLEAYLLTRLEAVVRAGIGDLPWVNTLVTQANLKKIMYASNPEGSKALRFDDMGKSLSGAKFIAYYKWVTAVDGPFQRILEGAQYVRASLEHWRKWLNPPDGDGVTITSVTVNGSDLHEHGLGVLFVKFNKPIGGPAEYTAAGEHEVVVKPEERSLEEKLFGTQDGSLANYVNAEVGLAGEDQITTYKQKVAQGFGTLCEKVVATRAKDLPKGEDRVLTQALKESLVFVLITGLTDLHGENVLWRDGKPYMIDADNALKLKFMTPSKATAQSGYTAYSKDASPALKEIYAGSEDYETSILQALQNPDSPERRRLLLKVQEIFAASVGRTVPIETGVWAGRLKDYIACSTVGDPGNRPEVGKVPTTKWQWCNYWASTVPTGKGANAPGLNGEVGVRNGTDGNFQAPVEAAQLFADFKVGQIPFYNYRYVDGKVLHNGQVVWDGQPIAERMAGLFALFPNQDRA